jgi:hypothetical protein
MRVVLNQTKNGLLAFLARSMKSVVAAEDFRVDGLHALPGQRAGILDLAVRRALDDTARPELRSELGMLRVVLVLGFLFGIEVVEVAEELVEAMRRWQELVAVAEVVLAELAGHVALRFQQLRDGRVFLLQSLWRAGQTNLRQAGPEGNLASEERRAPGSTALLAVVVGEDRTFPGDAIDVRRRVANHAAAIGTHIEDADVVTEDDQDVGLFLLSPYNVCGSGQQADADNSGGTNQPSM